MASEAKRQCEMKIPDELVKKLEQLPGGIEPILDNIEKEYGLSTSKSSVGAEQYSIAGSSPEILELAIETLERRFLGRGSQDSTDSAIVNELEDKRTTWKFIGEYARKASHLFLNELKELQRIDSVVVKEAQNCLEITCSYEDTELVKGSMDQLEHNLHDLYDQDVKLTGKGIDMCRIRQYIQNKQKHDRTILINFNEDGKTIKVCGKDREKVQQVAVQLRSGNPGGTPTLPLLTKSKKFKHQLKLPAVIVKKLEKQNVGIFPIITTIEREFGLEVHYIRDKHFVLFGPNMDVLELMSQTLVLRYIMKALPPNTITGMLQRQNAVWKFTGEYAKKIKHLFNKELTYIGRIKTVTVRAFPCQLNPTMVEILCSVKFVEHVKIAVEKLTSMLHRLFEHKVKIPGKENDKETVREFVRYSQEHDNTVLCLLDEESQILTVSGRNFYIVRQVAGEVQDMITSAPQPVPVPPNLKDTYRQQFKTQLDMKTIEKLQKQPGGLTPVMKRIEKEYGLKTVYHKNKVALISPSQEVLELATETLEDRYANSVHKTNRLGVIRKRKLFLSHISKV